jgi:hypothetical protein
VIKEDWRAEVRLRGVDPEELRDPIYRALLEHSLGEGTDG